jgi:pimeloyl-ACP methyl ester carboxylesterase
MTRTTYRSVDVDGFKVFYREAGRAGAPTLLLLHGFPSSSHMFRDLIPLLSDQLHLVAPDLPGFGRSDMPPRDAFNYTFDNIAGVIDRFTEVVGLDRFAIYVFDYGAPTGFRIAAKHPDRIAAIISQNGNAYEEGLNLFGDYKSNVALYPTFQRYFRAHSPPFLAVWGKNDPFFLPAGAEAFKRDMPRAEVHFFDTGHFALETHAQEIATKIREFLLR